MPNREGIYPNFPQISGVSGGKHAFDPRSSVLIRGKKGFGCGSAALWLKVFGFGMLFYVLGGLSFCLISVHQRRSAVKMVFGLVASATLCYGGIVVFRGKISPSCCFSIMAITNDGNFGNPRQAQDKLRIDSQTYFLTIGRKNPLSAAFIAMKENFRFCEVL